MTTFFIVTLAAIVTCFLIPASIFSYASKGNAVFNRPNSIKNSVFIPIFTVLLVSTCAAYFFIYNPKEFVSSLSFSEVTLPLIGGLIIYLSGYNHKLSKFTPLLILLCAASAVFAAPDDSMSFLPQFNVWINRVLLIAVWAIFTFIYRHTNTGDGMLSVQSLTISIGVIALSIFGVLPHMIGFMAWITTAALLALLAFSWHPSRVKISSTAASSFGFIIFSLIAFSTYEGCAPCVLIFSAYMLVDIVWAIAYKLSFIDRYKDVTNNTAYRQALEEGMNPAQAAAFPVRIQMLLIFFGVFQAYSPNSVSLVMLSAIITIWFCYKFRNVPAPTQSLKNINLQVIEELQERVKDIKDIVNRDDDI